MADPFPKAKQLARGERRYRRKVASPKQWQALYALKLGRCRTCQDPTWAVELHHVVTREDHGDDVANNLVPLCRLCHSHVHRRLPLIGERLLRSLTDAEYAYMIAKGGEDYPARAYGIRYVR